MFIAVLAKAWQIFSGPFDILTNVSVRIIYFHVTGIELGLNPNGAQMKIVYVSYSDINISSTFCFKYELSDDMVQTKVQFAKFTSDSLC